MKICNPLTQRVLQTTSSVNIKNIIPQQIRVKLLKPEVREVVLNIEKELHSTKYNNDKQGSMFQMKDNRHRRKYKFKVLKGKTE